MKYILFFIYGIFLSITLSGQQPEKYLELAPGSYTNSFEVCNGSYFIGTFGNDNSRIYIISDALEVIDEVIIPESDYNVPVSIHCLGDSSLLVTLKNGIIFKYDLNSKSFITIDTFSNESVDKHTLYEIDRVGNKIFAFGTSQSLPDSTGRFKFFEMFYELNLLNHQLIKTELPVYLNNLLHYMDVINSDSILILRYSDIGTFLNVLDSNFKILHRINMGIDHLPKFKYYSSQEIYFQFLNSESSYIYKSNIHNQGKIIYKDNSRKFISQIIKDGENNLIVGQNYLIEQTDSTQKYIDILKMDTSGNIIGSYTLQTSFDHSFHEMKLIDNDKVIITGFAHSNGRTIANYKPFICEIDLKSVSAVNKSIADNSITIFPNPANSKFNFESDRTLLKIEIYDQKGVLVNTLHTNSNEMQIRHLPVGLYYIKFHTGKGVITQKLIKN